MTFSRKMYKWPQEHENVFNITNKQKNANQTIMIHHVTSVRRAIVKKMRGKCRQRSREEGTLCTVDGNVNWYSHYGKQYQISSKI